MGPSQRLILARAFPLAVQVAQHSYQPTSPPTLLTRPQLTCAVDAAPHATLPNLRLAAHKVGIRHHLGLGWGALQKEPTTLGSRMHLNEVGGDVWAVVVPWLADPPYPSAMQGAPHAHIQWQRQPALAVADALPLYMLTSAAKLGISSKQFIAEARQILRVKPLRQARSGWQQQGLH